MWSAIRRPPGRRLSIATRLAPPPSVGPRCRIHLSQPEESRAQQLRREIDQMRNEWVQKASAGAQKALGLFKKWLVAKDKDEYEKAIQHTGARMAVPVPLPAVEEL